MYTIPAGKHSRLPLPIPMLISHYTVGLIFNDDCAYDLGNADQQDWNKLIGFTIGLFTFPKINPVHVNSLRIGWRYNVTTKMIELVPYGYVNGERKYPKKPYWEVRTGEPVIIEFTRVKGKGYSIRVNGMNFAISCKTSWIGWKLTPYFGGTSVAPHTMTIETYPV